MIGAGRKSVYEIDPLMFCLIAALVRLAKLRQAQKMIGANIKKNNNAAKK